MIDISASVKAGMLAALDASAAVTALVPVSRIYPGQVQSEPVYPFIRYGQPVITPYEDNCGYGTAVSVPIHVFAATRATPSPVNGESLCATICAAVVNALSSAQAFYAIDWTDTQIIPDASEADVWHGIVSFSVIAKA